MSPTEHEVRANVDLDAALRDMPWADDARFGAGWFLDWDAQVARTGEPVVGIVEYLRRANGDRRWVETNKVPLRDLDGEIIGILGTLEDFTEPRATEERLTRTLTELDKRVDRSDDIVVRASLPLMSPRGHGVNRGERA